MVDWQALIVFIVFLAFVTGLGFYAAYWRRGDLDVLHEWGLAGGRFGTIISWFLLGGDLYTAYTFIAVPALLYGKGAIGFFAVPYTIIVYPIVFVVIPRFWQVARAHGYVTPADFVRGRFDSSALALAVAVTGIVATMPYIALQMYGIEVSIAQMGVPVEGALLVAFLILAAYTYVSGLRAPAMISVVKDTMIWIVVIVSIVYIPSRLGGFGKIFAAVAHAHPKPPAAPPALVLPGKLYAAYATLALGSALALFLYPHVLTAILSTESRAVIRRNAAFLPAYSFLLGMIALLGFMALAAHVKPSPTYGANVAVPALLAKMFPSWFAGFAFAAITIGALVPASIMSIAAATLFTRNIYREYFHREVTDREETLVAKIVSLLVKVGALLFILAIPATYAIDFQLLGGVLILQTLPAVVLGLYTAWFHRWALFAGWAAGIVSGTWMARAGGVASIPKQTFSSTYALNLAGHSVILYPAVAALVLNLVVCIVLTPALNAIGVSRGRDETSPADYREAAAAGA